MGKGDRRSRRGKIWRGTTGKRRPKDRKDGNKTIEKEPPPAVIKGKKKP